MDAHHDRTRSLISQVKDFNERGQPFRVYHGSSNSTRRTIYDRKKVIDTSGFTHVLSVDRMSKNALVEPNVSMGALVDATLPFGLVPAVVPEFPAITTGGAFAGTSGESSSFRHGLFENTITQIEIVLANGEMVNASPDERSDLYYGAAGSFGTLGVVTLLHVQLIEAKPYVEIEYIAVGDTADAVREIEIQTQDDSVDYLDGIVLARDRGVIMSGRMVDKLEQGVQCQTYCGRSDPWFYIRAEEILKKSRSMREAVPVRDYLFRYERGAFWGGAYCFDYFLMPFNWLTRWLLDSCLHAKVMYHALHKSGLANQFIVQDIGFPFEDAPAFVDFLDQEHGIYPLWLCPLKLGKEMPLRPRDPKLRERMLNIGIWGPGPKDWLGFIEANRKIEKKTQELHGLKCLYAHAYYRQDEFWNIYDREYYDALRRKYHAAALPSVYQKVSVDPVQAAREAEQRRYGDQLKTMVKDIWPIRGLYGALQAVLGGEYLLSS